MQRRTFISALCCSALAACRPSSNGLTIGSKNFTEQLILGELLAQVIEGRSEMAVDRRFYLAGSYICQQAVLAGRIDMYVEYTGTALAAILKLPLSNNSSKVYSIVKEEYSKRFGLEVLPSLGFNNTFAMVMRGDEAKALGISKLSQLGSHASNLRLGVGYEFLERADGFPGLASTYQLKFAESPRVMDLGLLYRAIGQKQVDVIAGSNTDGLISAMGLIVLEDDRHYFPPYDAVPVVRRDTMQKYASVSQALGSLIGKLSADEMRKLNYSIDGEKRDVRVVINDFVNRKRLLA